MICEFYNIVGPDRQFARCAPCAEPVHTFVRFIDKHSDPAIQKTLNALRAVLADKGLKPWYRYRACRNHAALYTSRGFLVNGGNYYVRTPARAASEQGVT